MITPSLPVTGAAPPRDTSARPSETADRAPLTAFAESDGPSFWDLLDIINPLQHIPIVNTLYREVTGDTIGAAPRLAGGALFGGLIGLGASLADLVVQGLTGRDAGSHVLAVFEDAPDDEAVKSAAAPEPAPVAARVAAVAQSAPAMPIRPAAASEPHFMPITPRGSRAVPAFMPVPAATSAPSLPALQRAAAAQGLGNVDHPLLKGAPPGGGGPGWFESSVLDAMDKYEHGARLGAPPPAGQ